MKTKLFLLLSLATASFGSNVFCEENSDTASPRTIKNEFAKAITGELSDFLFPDTMLIAINHKLYQAGELSDELSHAHSRSNNQQYIFFLRSEEYHQKQIKKYKEKELKLSRKCLKNDPNYRAAVEEQRTLINADQS